MRHARAWLAGVGLAALVVGVVACADDAFGPEGTATKACVDDNDTGCRNGSPSASADAGEANTSDQNPAKTPGAPTADGVLIVHAARFPALRLCFSNFGDRLPQPDSTVMPQANVVGVEIGSLVRIDPLVDPKDPTRGPGTVYVIREAPVRSRPGDKQKTCGELVKRNDAGVDNGDLNEGTDYIIAKTRIDRPMGVNQAEVLAIGGCGSKPILKQLDGVALADVKSDSCGDGWTSDFGNADAFAVPLETSVESANDSSIPIQLFNMAPAVGALGGTLAVSFGEKGQPGGTPLLIDGKAFTTGAKTTLQVDQKKESMYGTQAFTVSATVGSATVTVTQTLADVQQLSSPSDTPTSYYLAASNYALLLLGDPSYKAPVDGVNDPRRGLHILAVPVLDPNRVDAGADAGDAGPP